jgi:hypothetical protein
LEYFLFFLKSSSSCLSLPPRLPFSSVCSSITCFRWQLPQKMRLTRLTFLPYIVCRMFHSYLTLCNNS